MNIVFYKHIINEFYLKYKEGKVSVIIYADNKQKFIKEYAIDKIRKIL